MALQARSVGERARSRAPDRAGCVPAADEERRAGGLDAVPENAFEKGGVDLGAAFHEDALHAAAVEGREHRVRVDALQPLDPRAAASSAARGGRLRFRQDQTAPPLPALRLGAAAAAVQQDRRTAPAQLPASAGRSGSSASAGRCRRESRRNPRRAAPSAGAAFDEISGFAAGGRFASRLIAQLSVTPGGRARAGGTGDSAPPRRAPARRPRLHSRLSRSAKSGREPGVGSGGLATTRASRPAGVDERRGAAWWRHGSRLGREGAPRRSPAAARDSASACGSRPPVPPPPPPAFFTPHRRTKHSRPSLRHVRAKRSARRRELSLSFRERSGELRAGSHQVVRPTRRPPVEAGELSSRATATAMTPLGCRRGLARSTPSLGDLGEGGAPGRVVCGRGVEHEERGSSRPPFALDHPPDIRQLASVSWCGGAGGVDEESAWRRARAAQSVETKAAGSARRESRPRPPAAPPGHELLDGGGAEGVGAARARAPPAVETAGELAMRSLGDAVDPDDEGDGRRRSARAAPPARSRYSSTSLRCSIVMSRIVAEHPLAQTLTSSIAVSTPRSAAIGLLDLLAGGLVEHPLHCAAAEIAR